MLTKELPVERVDPRAKRTRHLLMDAFGQLLSQKSFEDITVQDITERATVNRATFYAHFEDKYILVEQFLREWVQQELHKNLPPGSEFSQANLQRLIQTLCEFLLQLHTHCVPSNRRQFDSLVEQETKDQVHEILLRWLKQIGTGRAANQNQIELQATMTSWAMYGAALRWSLGERKESAVDFARSALPLMMASLDLPHSAVAKTKSTTLK